ncbi:MAG TPA: chemotaxis protein CheB [Bryobacteraceae bacterium]|jgi:two-component system CheB/CheR fusion protein
MPAPPPAGQSGSARRREAPPSAQTGGTAFPIAGVGASAGGLEAFTQLLNSLPPDPGIAFVFIQHLQPKHESMLTLLLSKVTGMKVVEVRQRTPVRPNHVYVMPANADLAFSGGTLRVSARQAAPGRHLPVDHFFRSLAKAEKNRAIGVILSGTASDGTLGIKAIKEAGGITFAQDAESAKFCGMPQSAALSGCVDFVLSPSEMAAELSRIANHPSARHASFRKTVPPTGEDDWTRLFKLLRSATGVDFTFYKRSAIARRVARRMKARKTDRLGQYIKRLQGDREELDALYRDVLVRAAGAFRKPELFHMLRHRIVPQILTRKASGDPIRVWVPGCSTGEEVYSIAICLLESLGAAAVSSPIQIFGTEIDEAAIQKARVGVYTKRGLKGLSEERLRRFFSPADGNYQVNSAVRDLCLFARHDLTKDPPFSKLDLIACDRVLTCFEPVLQKKILASFHYALRDAGILLTGKSEKLEESTELFVRVNRENSFFVRTPGAKVQGPGGAVSHGGHTPVAAHRLAAHAIEETAKLNLEQQADRMVWESLRCAGLVVDEDLQILHYRGDTSPYVRPIPGKASFQLLKMLREDLTVDVLAAVAKARRMKGVAKRKAVQIKMNGAVHCVDVEVRPLKGLKSSGRHYLILLSDVTPMLAAEARSWTQRETASNGDKLEIRKELKRTQDYLEAIIKKQEANNEQLTTANEEAQSSLEELQSTNEELETAKEELQSSNEELVTLNEQLESRNSELGRLSDDLENVLTGLSIPILILDEGRRIRRFTPAAGNLLRLLPGDIGRPIGNLEIGIDLRDLDGLISRSMRGSSGADREARAENGRWYSARIRPFVTAEGKVDGVLIAFVDIQEVKEAHDRSMRGQKLSTAILNAAQGLIAMVLDRHGQVVQFNRAGQAISGYSEEEVLGKPFWDVLTAPEDRGLAKTSFANAMKGISNQGESHWLTKTGQRRLVDWFNSLVKDGEAVEWVIRTGVDVTDREEAQTLARESGATVQALLDAAPQAVLIFDTKGQVVLANPAAEGMFGYRRKEMIGLPLFKLIPERFRQIHEVHIKGFSGSPARRFLGTSAFFGLRKDSSEFPAEVGSSYVETRIGELGISFVSDLTETKKNEAALVRYQTELRNLTARLLGMQETGNRELARELHDDLSQKLAALGMEISTLLQPAKAPNEFAERVQALGARVNGLAEEVHALSRRLHPAILDELGLRAAVKEECIGFSSQTGVPVQFESRELPAHIPDSVSLCLCRVAQESLRNIAKHAGAAEVRVEIWGAKDGIHLRVVDSGRGFNLDEAKGKGLGLISMEERVRLENGNFAILSTPGHGAAVEVFVPLRSK